MMSRLSVFGLAVLAGFAISCGDDKPTAPGQDLVGSWTYQGTDFSSTAASNLQNYLLSQGVDQATAQQFVAEFRNEMDRGFRQTGLEILRFNEDRTYEDNSGNSGVWSVLGDVLTIVEEDGFTIQCQYFIDGEDLTLILSKERYLNIIRQTEDAVELDPDTLALLDILFGDGDSLRLFYRAR
ncbi:MAG: hypothetical protein OXR72_09310 [Gemmatimonadota bacterium]|nr:hypothetical protein [Gemmatimonadota bacterium]